MHVLAYCAQNMPMMNWTHKKTLKDCELRFQKRYLDFMVNNDIKKLFILRSKIINFFRSYLDNLEFLEVETPILN